jgi:hypothetical protein
MLIPIFDSPHHARLWKTRRVHHANMHCGIAPWHGVGRATAFIHEIATSVSRVHNRRAGMGFKSWWVRWRSLKPAW